MIPTDRDRKRFYALDRRLLPRLLREAGYKISSVGNNFFLLGYPQIGLSLGFDEVADVRHPVLDSPATAAAASMGSTPSCGVMRNRARTSVSLGS